MNEKELRSLAQSIAARVAHRYHKDMGFEIGVIEEVEHVMRRDTKIIRSDNKTLASEAEDVVP